MTSYHTLYFQIIGNIGNLSELKNEEKQHRAIQLIMELNTLLNDGEESKGMRSSDIRYENPPKARSTTAMVMKDAINKKEKKKEKSSEVRDEVCHIHHKTFSKKALLLRHQGHAHSGSLTK